jgi:hypothetical protein
LIYHPPLAGRGYPLPMSYPYGIIRASAQEIFWRKRFYGARSLVIPPSSEERLCSPFVMIIVHPSRPYDRSISRNLFFVPDLASFSVRLHPRHRRCSRRCSLARLQPRLQHSIHLGLSAIAPLILHRYAHPSAASPLLPRALQRCPAPLAALQYSHFFRLG